MSVIFTDRVYLHSVFSMHLLGGIETFNSRYALNILSGRSARREKKTCARKLMKMKDFIIQENRIIALYNYIYYMEDDCYNNNYLLFYNVIWSCECIFLCKLFTVSSSFISECVRGEALPFCSWKMMVE